MPWPHDLKVTTLDDYLRNQASRLVDSLRGQLICQTAVAYLVVVMRYGDDEPDYPVGFAVSKLLCRRFGDGHEDFNFQATEEDGVVIMNPPACEGSEPVRIQVDMENGWWVDSQGWRTIAAFSTYLKAVAWSDRFSGRPLTFRPGKDFDGVETPHQHIVFDWTDFTSS